ncbi:MAG TPA: energy transducer TonB [Bacteroidia bacterium]|nr:energy transducer TonB [Bacteroidia bacterium]
MNILFFAACSNNKVIPTNSENKDSSSSVNTISNNKTTEIVQKENSSTKDSVSITATKTVQDTSGQSKHPKMYPLKLAPKYLGGIGAALQFIFENIHYPDEALKNKISGTVYVDFRINRDGTVSDVVVRHGLGYGCDEEAIRVIKMMKGWQTAERESVPFSLPVIFNLPKK